MYSAAALYRTGTLQQVGLSAAVVHHVGPAIVGGKHSDFAVYHGHWALGTRHWALGTGLGVRQEHAKAPLLALASPSSGVNLACLWYLRCAVRDDWLCVRSGMRPMTCLEGGANVGKFR